MKGKLILALALSLAVLAALMGSALAADMPPRDAYLDGMEAYRSREYAEAEALFGKAGNHQDARLWMHYCAAIGKIVDGKGTQNEIEEAKARFELLAAHDFQQADQWVLYCTGRLYELRKVPKSARPCYEQIVIHDSVERYLVCAGEPDLLESERELSSRILPGDQHMKGEVAYETATEFYEAEDYELAAAYFWLAGNYEDALLWRCYCQAIKLVTVKDDYAHADVLFKLLESQGFEMAAQWSMYCKGRDYENRNVKKKAVECYREALVHDSVERYLRMKDAE